MYSLDEDDVDLELPYTIKHFKIPYTLTLETVSKLLPRNVKDAAPEHMYL